ncbi:universal stress protein [Zhouia amylolytica]|uniref:universal stress protein n=1 Tax=Zhouia amylolytica TaxID=376730 RepID=UPI0020CF1388|nr:universal stress protein [Zhouia amylolytica]MCQ0110510.1 universal stress protein [Zhouia amylolytica]
MKNILIPTDFSDNSWNAIVYGLTLFEKERCQFYLLHVEDLGMYAFNDTATLPYNSTIDKKQIDRSKAKLKSLLGRIYEKFPGTNHSFGILVEYDFLVDAIKKQVSEKKIDLIIMGTKGASSLKKDIVGSHTSDVITRVKCPLLVIPEKAKAKIPEEIAFPTDYRIFYPLNVLVTLMDLAQKHGASIRCLHAVKEHFEHLDQEQLKNKELLDDYFDKFNHSFHQVTSKRLDKAVQCFTESRDIDMIAMVAKNLNFFQQILFKPTVAEISYHTHIPFLVLHEQIS